MSKKLKLNRKGKTLVAVWMPVQMDRAVVEVAAASDSDKSKFIRAAIREKLNRTVAA